MVSSTSSSSSSSSSSSWRIFSVFFFICTHLLSSIAAQLTIPARYDGFPFNHPSSPDAVLIDAFFDPLCPDSRDAWPALKKVAQYHRDHLQLILHPFALPYHHNSYFTCRALHIMNGINNTFTYPLLEEFFKHQNTFSNQQTIDETPASVLEKIVQLASDKFTVLLSSEFESDFQSGFQDSSTDQATRISFKYGCSRAVTGTPYFFVNGFPLYDADQNWDYFKWRSVIDPLVYRNSECDVA